MQINSSRSLFGKIKIFNDIFVKSLFVSLWFIGLTYVECMQGPANITQEEDCDKNDQNGDHIYINCEDRNIENNIPKKHMHQDAQNVIYNKHQTKNEPDVAKFSNKKAGVIEIGSHIGYHDRFLGFEIEGGLGLNLGKGIHKRSENIELSSDDIDTEYVPFKQNILYGYLAPKITMQISRFVLKVGPRFQWGSIGIRFNDATIDEKTIDKINKLKCKTFNLSLQIEIACSINKNIATGLRFIWSPSHKLKYSKVEDSTDSDTYKCNEYIKYLDPKYGDLSVSFYIAGHYKSTKGFVFGADLSIGWKMSQLIIETTYRACTQETQYSHKSSTSNFSQQLAANTSTDQQYEEEEEEEGEEVEVMKTTSEYNSNNLQTKCPARQELSFQEPNRPRQQYGAKQYNNQQDNLRPNHTVQSNYMDCKAYPFAIPH